MFEEVVFPDVIKPGCVKNEGGKEFFLPNYSRPGAGEGWGVQERQGT